MVKKSAFKVTFNEYIERMFPCTCASYFLDREKKDPHCFLHNNKPQILKMMSHLRDRTIAETKNVIKTTSYINEKGGIEIPPFELDKDKFFVS